TAGTYTVTVTDANGCSITSTTIITEPPVLTAAATTVSNILCFSGNNGTATVNPGGGVGPYGYQWSPAGGNTQTTNNITAGTYTVTVTDANGCSITSTTIITEPPVLTAAATTVSNISCFSGNNGTATVNPGGGVGPYGYQWSPAGGNTQTTNNISAGTY